AERALALAEQWPDVGGDETGEVEGACAATRCRLGADRVAVVEHFGPTVEEADHRFDVAGHRLTGHIDEPFGVLGPQLRHLVHAHATRHVHERVMGRGLVGDDIDLRPDREQVRHHVCGVAQYAYRQGLAPAFRLHGPAERVVHPVGEDIEVAGVQTTLDPRLVNLDAQHDTTVH